MDSPLTRFLAAQNLGTPHDQTALKETLSLPGGGVAPAWLCTTDHGVFIAGVAGEPGAVIDLGRATDLRYQRRSMGDRITVSGQTFTLPIGSGDRTRGLIAHARLTVAAPHPGSAPPQSGPFIQPGSDLETHWLSGALAPDDPLIAWLPTTSEHTFSDSIGGKTDADFRFCMTAAWTLLVAVSRYGEVHTRPLSAAPIVLTENRLSRDTAAIDEHEWRLSRGGLEQLTPLHALPAMSRDRRLREAARLLALRDRPDDAAALLIALRSPDALDALSLARLQDNPLACKAALHDLTETDTDAGRLILWARRWALPLAESRTLLGEVLEALSTDGASWAIPLHRQVRDLQLAAEKDLFAQAEIDLELAEHLIISGRRAEAVTILEPRWLKLPDEDLRAVLPPPGADLTSGEGGPPLHIRTLELLAIARGPDTTPDVSAIAALARHLPLVSARLNALAALGDPLLSPRAEQIRALLDPGGLASVASTAPPPTQPLSPEQVESVRHPVARESGTMGWIQTALARATPPESSTLQDFCEQIRPHRHTEVVDAISSACVALGMPAVPGFISMGQKRVGVRSHEHPEPFLLIGGDHLDPESELFLRPAELRAIIGAEIAHLRFGHSRITSSDVWAGVWDKGTTAIETAAIVLPFMKYIPVDMIGKQRTYEAVARVIPVAWLRQLYEVDDAVDLADVVTDNIGRLGEAAGGAASTASGHMGTASEAAGKLLPTQKAKQTDVGLESAQVLAAHRTMQLTADRAALLLSGDPVATVRSMCLVHSRLAAELVIAERTGLRAALARRGPDGSLILPDLALRIAALIAFYLSEEYTVLSEALRQPAG